MDYMTKSIGIRKVVMYADHVSFSFYNECRGCLFGQHSSCNFFASNGIELHSSVRPEIGAKIYVCGVAPQHDNETLRVTIDVFNKIIVAANEYNVFFKNCNVDNEIEQLWNELPIERKLDSAECFSDYFISPLVIMGQWQDLPKQVAQIIFQQFLPNAR